MKLFEMKNWSLTVSEEAWGLQPFKKILTRDKSKDKELAMKEMLFIYFFSDIKSDYLLIDEEDRIQEIKKDIGLPEKWEKDKVIDEGIELYERMSLSVIEELYKNTLKAARDIGKYLKNTNELLAERDASGKPTIDISKVTTAAEKIPKLMRNLRDAYKEVIKEQEDNDNKQKGSRKFNTFEQGLDI